MGHQRTVTVCLEPGTDGTLPDKAITDALDFVTDKGFPHFGLFANDPKGTDAATREQHYLQIAHVVEKYNYPVTEQLHKNTPQYVPRDVQVVVLYKPDSGAMTVADQTIIQALQRDASQGLMNVTVQTDSTTPARSAITQQAQINTQQAPVTAATSFYSRLTAPVSQPKLTAQSIVKQQPLMAIGRKNKQHINEGGQHFVLQKGHRGIMQLAELGPPQRGNEKTLKEQTHKNRPTVDPQKQPKQKTRKTAQRDEGATKDARLFHVICQEDDDDKVIIVEPPELQAQPTHAPGDDDVPEHCRILIHVQRGSRQEPLPSPWQRKQFVIKECGGQQKVVPLRRVEVGSRTKKTHSMEGLTPHRRMKMTAPLYWIQIQMLELTKPLHRIKRL
eukprot:GHVQ01034298.1.p1 GENE.GHVQ01034298.1~~GHVQ01034298.1.p1  ORF type:complete len:388 (+),score=51.26 GHVQ01034298.1:1222-2385(+)